MKVVINKCFGGFGLSDAAYEKLIEWGVPLRDYVEEKTDPATGLFMDEPLNDGEIIFRSDDDGPGWGKYWDTWTRDSRTHPLILKAVEELGEAANGRCAKLQIVEIPDGTPYEISEYDGLESIEAPRTFYG